MKSYVQKIGLVLGMSALFVLLSGFQAEESEMRVKDIDLDLSVTSGAQIPCAGGTVNYAVQLDNNTEETQSGTLEIRLVFPQQGGQTQLVSQSLTLASSGPASNYQSNNSAIIDGTDPSGAYKIVAQWTPATEGNDCPKEFVVVVKNSCP